MSVFRFDEREGNFLATEEGNYFLWRDEGGVAYLLPADCPHRGGPLWLGTLHEDGVRCPWHDNVVPLRALKRRALPTIVNRGVVTAVTPGNGAHTRLVTGVDGGSPCQHTRATCT